MFVVSVATPEQALKATTEGVPLWPEHWNWNNYAEALRQMGSQEWFGFFDALANTIVVTVLSVVGQVLSCSLVGYAFARLRFRGRNPLFI
ncbi:MAG: carbohydrate ABC transporter permease, partial [Planctomycetota bacterium]